MESTEDTHLNPSSGRKNKQSSTGILGYQSRLFFSESDEIQLGVSDNEGHFSDVNDDEEIDEEFTVPAAVSRVITKQLSPDYVCLGEGLWVIYILFENQQEANTAKNYVVNYLRLTEREVQIFSTEDNTSVFTHQLLTKYYLMLTSEQYKRIFLHTDFKQLPTIEQNYNHQNSPLRKVLPIRPYAIVKGGLINQFVHFVYNDYKKALSAVNRLFGKYNIGGYQDVYNPKKKPDRALRVLTNPPDTSTVYREHKLCFFRINTDLYQERFGDINELPTRQALEMHLSQQKRSCCTIL